MSPKQFSLYIMTEDTFTPCWEHGMEIPDVLAGLHRCGRRQTGSCPATMARTRLPSSIQPECGQRQSSTDIMQAYFESPFSFSAPFSKINLPPQATISEDARKLKAAPGSHPVLALFPWEVVTRGGAMTSSVMETASFESLHFHCQATSPFPVALLSSPGQKQVLLQQCATCCLLAMCW